MLGVDVSGGDYEKLDRKYLRWYGLRLGFIAQDINENITRDINVNTRSGLFCPPKNICAHIYNVSYNKQGTSEDWRSGILNFEKYIKLDVNEYMRCGVFRPPTIAYQCLHAENFELHAMQMHSRPAAMSYECPNDENLETHVLQMCFLHPRCGLSGPQLPCITP